MRDTIIRLAVLGALLPGIASAQPFLRHNWGTVESLPAVSASSPGRLFTVTDGADSSDCTTGGGSASVLCRDTGAAWVAVGSSGGAGAVTSVALSVPTGFTISGSPITTSGTFTLGLSAQTANTVWAGPTTGSAAAPAFRALVAADIPDLSSTYLTAVPDPIASDTTGNAATATALAANGANCSAGQAAAGVDASGAAEGCAAYLTDITGETIGDLTDVDETGAAAGEALVSAGDGTWGPSSAAVCLSDGTNCPAAGAVGFGDIASGTNTTAAMVVGAGSTLKVASTGAIDASGIDADGDGVREIRMNGTTLELNPADDGTPEATLANGGALTITGALTLNEYVIFGGGRTLRAIAADVLCYGETGATSVCTNNSANQFLAASDWSIGFSPDTSPYGGDGDTLLTRAGAAHLRVSGATTSTGAVFRIEPLATAPAACTIGDQYVDTSGAQCGCVATNTWENKVTTGSCT
jgi:hypothetical protein